MGHNVGFHRKLKYSRQNRKLNVPSKKVVYPDNRDIDKTFYNSQSILSNLPTINAENRLQHLTASNAGRLNSIKRPWKHARSNECRIRPPQKTTWSKIDWASTSAVPHEFLISRYPHCGTTLYSIATPSRHPTGECGSSNIRTLMSQHEKRVSPLVGVRWQLRCDPLFIKELTSK